MSRYYPSQKTERYAIILVAIWSMGIFLKNMVAGSYNYAMGKTLIHYSTTLIIFYLLYYIQSIFYIKSNEVVRILEDDEDD